MTLTDTIQSAIKSNRAIIGFEESIKYMKLNKAKTIIIASNSPNTIKEEIGKIANVAKSKVEIFEGSSKDLGIACGKPFAVTTIVIKG